jgi:hypothetical protein
MFSSRWDASLSVIGVAWVLSKALEANRLSAVNPLALDLPEASIILITIIPIDIS